jgi:predicted transposase/invertase (TIGR01784 family)
MANHHIHDRFFRSFFSNPRHLRGVLETALPPEIADSLNLATIAIEPGTWIDRHNREHLSDLAASVSIAGHEEGEGPATARVYILIEHKSWSDAAVLLQLLRYMVQVWTAERRAGSQWLTPIIPIVVYHGRSGSIPGSFAELFPATIPEALKRYQVRFGADVLDLSERTIADLRGDPAARAALWLMRTIHRTTEQILAELQAVLRGVEDILSDDDYEAIASYIFHGDELSAEDLISKIESSVHQRRIREGLLTTAEQLMKKGFEEGEEIGLRRGEEIGIRRGEELGLREGRRELVRSMIDHGMTVSDVSHVTGLTEDEVQTLLDKPAS